MNGKPKRTPALLLTALAVVVSALLLLSLSALSVSAAKPFVVDEAGLLTDPEEEELSELLARAGERTGCDLVVLTVSDPGGKGAQAYADDWYEAQGYSEDGILLFLCTGSGEWAISTSGRAIYALTEYRLYEIEDRAISLFRSGEYAAGFRVFAGLSERYLETPAEETDDPIPEEPARRFPFAALIVVSLIVGVIVGVIGVGILKRKLKTVEKKETASDYVREGSFRLTKSRDFFLYRTLVKRERAQQQSGGPRGGPRGGGPRGGGPHGGPRGGGMHYSSSGRMHGGRSGRL